MQQILNLVSKMREKFIILNSQGNPEAVILPFSEYQKLKIQTNLTNENFSAKIKPEFNNTQNLSKEDFFIDQTRQADDFPAKLWDNGNKEEDEFYLEEIS